MLSSFSHCFFVSPDNSKKIVELFFKERKKERVARLCIFILDIRGGATLGRYISLGHSTKTIFIQQSRVARLCVFVYSQLKNCQNHWLDRIIGILIFMKLNLLKKIFMKLKNICLLICWNSSSTTVIHCTTCQHFFYMNSLKISTSIMHFMSCS